tara:strand:- start:2860 stop:4395 length:1536 start_codon:yes stop_codon:yes gene_type:complete
VIKKNIPKEIANELIEYYNKGELLNIIQKANSTYKEYSNSEFILNLMGVSFIGLEKFKEAENTFKKVIKINSTIPDVFNNLAVSLQKQNNFKEAETYFKKAINLKADYAEAYNGLGLNYKYQNDINKAVKYIKIAISINKKFSEAYNNLGNVQNSQGEFEKAIENFKKAINFKSNLAEAYLNYTYSKKITAKDKTYKMLSKLCKRSQVSRSDKIFLNFAMSKSKFDMNKYDQGFKFLDHSNKLIKENMNYNLNKDQEVFQKIRNYFDKNEFVNKKFKTIKKPIPIFIVGMPRSGTSLIEQILSNHSKVYGGGELDFLNNIIASLDLINEDFSKICEIIRKEYLLKLQTLSEDEFITDKMPLNFKWIGFIKHALPEAKIIHVKRKPIAVCWSNYKQYFYSKEMAFTYSKEDIAGYYNLYNDLMNYWKMKYPNLIYDLSYESFTHNQKTETENLINFINLKWEDNLINFHENKRNVMTASYSQVRKKIYQGSSEEWRKYEKWLEPMLSILNDK